MKKINSLSPGFVLAYFSNQSATVRNILGDFLFGESKLCLSKAKENEKTPYTIKSNQYLPNGFGNPCATYYYITDDLGRVYHHDGKWRIKPLIEMTKYWFKELAKAEQKLTELNKPNRVIFYVESEFGVLAVFPDQPYKNDFDAEVICYSHIGQHSGLCPEYLNECRIATLEEYQPLMEELRSIGYVLDILNHSLEFPLRP